MLQQEWSLLLGFSTPPPPREYIQLNAKQGINHACGPEDGWVSTYCPALLLLWEGHIHVQAIFMVDIFLYIYKYLFKGLDHDQKFT